jgi:uncharacterized protein YkwD
MGMRFAAIDFQFRVNRAAEAIVWNHSAHSPLHQQFRVARSPRTQILRFVAADEARETHVTLLVFFLSSHAHFLGVDHDDEVASIDVRREDGFLFAAQKSGSFDGNLAKDLVLGVNDPPLALDLRSFGRKRFHQEVKKARKLRDASASVKSKIVSLRPQKRGNDGGTNWHSICFMEIIMTRLTFFAASLVLVAPFLSNQAFAGEECVSGSAVIREMNLARQNPALYASYIEELRSHFDGRSLVLSGHTRWCTKEGVGALDDAIHFLRSVRPLSALTLSPGMCRGAADHCADQMNGAMGHDGSDRSNPGARMSRYGVWSSSWGENISYGKTTAHDIVIALIIDDGLPARKHRQNIFNPNFNYAGAAYGAHARYRSVCSIDFAGGYTERGQTVAQNF